MAGDDGAAAAAAAAGVLVLVVSNSEERSEEPLLSTSRRSINGPLPRRGGRPCRGRGRERERERERIGSGEADRLRRMASLTEFMLGKPSKSSLESNSGKLSRLIDSSGPGSPIFITGMSNSGFQDNDAGGSGVKGRGGLGRLNR